MSDRDTAASRRYAGGGGYDWRRGGSGSPAGTASKGDYYNNYKNTQGGSPAGESTTVGGSSYTQNGHIRTPEQDRYFSPVTLYTDVPDTVAGLNFSSPRPVIQDKSTAVARWDAPIGSQNALPEWLREQTKQMAYSYYGRKVPDSWVRGFWEKAVNSAAELGDDASALQSMYTKVLSDEGDTTGGGSSYYSGGGYGGGGYGGGGGQVSLTNPTSARGLLLQTMQGVLGRNPTEREYKDFIDTLKQTEMANPNTVSVEGDVVVQSGGTDPGVLALEFAQASEDYRSTQANKFYNAFMGALGGGVSG